MAQVSFRNTVSKVDRLVLWEKIFLLAIGLYAFWAAFFANSHFTVEDAAIHSEIANVLKTSFYPQTYAPVANVPITYPPLFHYLALALSFFGITVLDSVKLLGALSFAFFPVAMYFLGSLFGRRAGLFSALFAILTVNIFMVLIFSEYPQILSFNLFAMFVYFYFQPPSAIGKLETRIVVNEFHDFRGKYILSGIFLGLTALAHPFTAFFAAASALVLFVLKRDAGIIKTISIGFLISLFWLPKYVDIFSHFSGATWNNARWYSPAGFIPLESIWNTILRLNPFLVALSIMGIAMLLKMQDKKDAKWKFFLFLYLLPAVFTIYHYSPAQYKFLDIFTIPLVVLSGIGADYLLQKSKGVGRQIPALFMIAILAAASLPFPLLKIQEYQSKYSAISLEGIETAKWLKGYDSDPSRILLSINSSTADKARLVFESELVFSQIANKIPLDGTISDLEAYTPEYKKQLSDREEMMKGNISLIRAYGVKYVISGTGKCPFEKIYRSGDFEICRV